MRKYIHPLKNKTIIILSNGSSYQKKWIFFKQYLKLENDFLKNKKWFSLKKN
jgi:hypothetical protein